jgi:AcrR family transcriptional regulator
LRTWRLKVEEIRMDIQDRRVKRTQNLLAKALIVLTLEKGYEAVTIRDITERANVGYATFFRHYHDKDALLRDVSDVVFEDLSKLLPTSPANYTAEVGTPLFRYVQENSKVILVLLSSRGSSTLMQHIIDITTQNVLRQNVPFADSVVPPEIAANHLVTASIALIQWWLEHDMPYPAERMGAIINELVIRPTRAIAFLPADLPV